MTSFSLLALGTGGGPYDGDLAGYLVWPRGGKQALALDAGTLLSGLEIAESKGLLTEFVCQDASLSRPGEVLQRYVGAYFLSHAHLDHVAGLVINSQVDLPKPILGLEQTLKNMQTHLFNWVIWPNYANEGTPPCLGLYTYQPLVPGQPVRCLDMTVEVYILSHPHEYQSSALLIESQGQYLLYVGDTAADSAEKEQRLAIVWDRIAPLIQNQTLRGILIECSAPGGDRKEIHYGHLNTNKLLEELAALQHRARCSLQGLPILVIHRKKDLTKKQLAFHKIQQELERACPDLCWMFPAQGEQFLL